MNASEYRVARFEAALEALAGDVIRDVRERYPSAESLPEAGFGALAACGVPEQKALMLSLIPELARYTATEAFGTRVTLTNLEDTAAYLRARYIGVPVECFYLLLLTASGRLIRRVLLQEGTVDETGFYLREVLRAVAGSNAEAVVLCHNHPGGTMRPSGADLSCTLSALRALQPLGVTLLDHLIIAGDGYVSIRKGGYLDSSLWILQNEKSRLNRLWLEKDKKGEKSQ